MSDDNTKSPKELAAEQLAAEKVAREKQRLAKKFSKYSLLIAEDSEDLQMALVEEAEARGFSVVKASDGAEAVRKAQTQSFDAILVDMNLPKKLGHEVVDEVRVSSMNTKCVIVVLSGYLKKDVVQSLAGKIEKAFTKPADIEVVMDTIISLLEQKNTKKTG